MKIYELGQSPPPEIQRAMTKFESQFGCSLGGGRSYQFTYPQGYHQYLAALGESRCYVAEKDGQIAGLIGGAVLPLRKPDGTEQRIVFCEEVKLVPALRRTTALWPLLDRFQEWMLAQSDIVISVVLDETPNKPSDYTGRAGIVPFREVERIIVLRVAASDNWVQASDRRFLATDDAGADCHRQLTEGGYAVLSPRAEARSEMPPVWLVHPSGEACGRLEDRRKVRRVTVNDGTELRPVFLGSFAFADAQAGVELIEVALRHSAGRDFTAVRMALSQEDFQDLAAVTGERQDTQIIPAGMYVTGMTTDAPWTLSGLEV